MFQETDRNEVIYTRGCIEAVKQWFKENMIVIGGVAIGLALMQVTLFHIISIVCHKTGNSLSQDR